MTDKHKSPGVLLFDLDGTLLPVGQGFFSREYPNAAAPYFAHIVDSGTFKKALFESTSDMVRNLDPSITNGDAFGASFAPKLGVEWPKLWDIFDRFYKETFPGLSSFIPEPVNARAVVSACLEQGWEIVLATNPIFPEIAIKERMRWCGIDSLNWKLITTLEHMHYCKPNIEYYQEIMQRINVSPESCVMIGNHVYEDMVASKLGIKTILVEDHVIDEAPPHGVEPIKPDAIGLLTDVPEIVKQFR